MELPVAWNLPDAGQPLNVNFENINPDPMKKLLMILCVACSAQVFAQELSMGLRAGITRSSIATKLSDFNDQEAQTGFTGGVYLKAKVLGFFVMPEIMYTQRGGEIKNIGSNKIHYVDGAVLFGKQFFKVFRINAGPVFQYAISNDRVSAQAASPNESEIKDYVIGIQAGAGIDFFKFSFDVRYDAGLTEAAKIIVANAAPNAPNNFSARNSMWVFTLGYRLWKI
jgi:hypothetical protein